MVRSNLPSLFNSTLGGLNRWRGEPTLAVQPTENGIHIRASAPGLDPDSIEVLLEEQHLVVKALTKAYGPAQAEDQEDVSAGFSLRLPFRPDPAATEASYEQGMLLIHLVRPETDLPRRIELRTD